MQNKIREFLLKKDNLVILVLVGILLLVIAWPISDSEEKKENVSDLWYTKSGNIESVPSNLLEQEISSDNTSTGVIYEKWTWEQHLESRLEEILGSMYGVGKVKVMITLADSGEKVIEKDIPLERSNIAENDSSGGSRNTNEMNTQETTVYVTNAEGEKIPYVINEKSPMIEGVTVVAQGGGNAAIQKNISDVIQALFGIEAHKIIVVKMKQEG